MNKHQLAIHEAAHAVVGWSLRIRVEYLKLEDDNGEPCPHSEETVGEPTHWFVFQLAGPVADERTGAPDLVRRTVAHLEVARWHLEGTLRPEAIDEIDAKYAATHARELVDEHWPKIQAVADRLEASAQGYVSGADLRTMLEP